MEPHAGYVLGAPGETRSKDGDSVLHSYCWSQARAQPHLSSEPAAPFPAGSCLSGPLPGFLPPSPAACCLGETGTTFTSLHSYPAQGQLDPSSLCTPTHLGRSDSGCGHTQLLIVPSHALAFPASAHSQGFLSPRTAGTLLVLQGQTHMSHPPGGLPAHTIQELVSCTRPRPLLCARH
jgi:hypothetical protein